MFSAAFWTARRALLAVAVVSFGLVAAGLVLGAMLNLHPCPLCIFQRVLYLAVGGFALLGALGAGQPALRWGGAVLAIATALGGIATAAYQSWMQFFPTPSMECGFSDPTPIERLVDVLGAWWPDLFLATGMCSSKEWVFLGLSMANWSIFCFAALAGGAFLAARRPA
jgi:protein dithiol:quinone oxidoreductase